VGDRGVRLSGGQRQRLALARAILRQPRLLVLDEATSALDAASEERIQKAVEHVALSTTLLVITHRLSTVRSADHIYYLEDGVVAEEGSWTQLVEAGGRFRRMMELQELGVELDH
jgi:ABC-type multidrug transport system fused ATPase/permease subunit